MSKNYTRIYKTYQHGRKRHAIRLLSSTGRPIFAIAGSTNGDGGLKSHKARKPWSKGKVRSVCNFRLAGLLRLIESRHGHVVELEDAAWYYRIALPHLAAKAWAYDLPEERIMSDKWVSKWAPGFVAYKGRDWFDQQEQLILLEFDNDDGRPSLPSADEVALSLKITAVEVEGLRLKTIGAIDRRKPQRVAEAKAADKAYQKQVRQQKGAKPREDSREARKPWEDLGISRASYFRHLASGKLVELNTKPKRATETPDDSTKRVLRLIAG